MGNQRFLSCREAARLLGISDDTVRRMIRRHELDAVRVGRRLLRVRTESIERHIDRAAAVDQTTS